MTSQSLEPRGAFGSSEDRRDAVTAGLGALLVGGVFTDGWAHFNRPGLESFFTPWHAVLYGSLGVMTSWLAVVAWRSRAGGIPTASSLPRGYGLAAAGAAIFAAGGLGDMLWHLAFGVEVAIDALVSPTHLMLGTGGVLILSTPMRSQGVLSPSPGRDWPVASRISLALTTAVAVFFLLYTSAFAQAGPLEGFVPTPENEPGHESSELPVIAALASYLLTTLVITLPVLFMARATGRVPRGGAVLVVATVAVLPVVVVGLPRAPVAGALGAVAGALLWETVNARLLPRLGARTAAWAGPAALALLVWAGHMAGLAVADTLRWPVSLWSGVVVLAASLAALTGFALSGPDLEADRWVAGDPPGIAPDGYRRR